MIRIAREGVPSIVIAGFVSTVAYLADISTISLAGALVFLFLLYFFRDPERNIPSEKNIVVSPADGKVILIKEILEEEFLRTEAVQISIFMSPLDVHVNRAPCDAVVESIRHNSGGFRAAYTDDASLYNENTEILLSTPYGRMVLKQIAGILARRIVCRVKPGDRLRRGERFGMIKLGSRVDILLPKNMKVKVIVKEGQKVKAGESILATLEGE
jgi:phosphatidylserine decarboxylase